MSIDVRLLSKISPARRSALRQCLARAGQPTLVPLDDGSVLVPTGTRWPIVPDPDGLRELLVLQFGDALFDLSEDPRGIYVFPDICEPRGRTYEQVLEELGTSGGWLSRTGWTAPAAAPESPVLDALRQLGPTVTLEELVAAMGAEVERAMGSVDPSTFDVLCVLLAPGTALERWPWSVNAVHTLADGTRLVVTTSAGPDSAEKLALDLGLPSEAGWVGTHGDPRGFLTFRRPLLPEVTDAPSYTAAVSTVGDRGQWVRPQTIEDLMAEQHRRSEAFFRR